MDQENGSEVEKIGQGCTVGQRSKNGFEIEGQSLARG